MRLPAPARVRLLLRRLVQRPIVRREGFGCLVSLEHPPLLLLLDHRATRRLGLADARTSTRLATSASPGDPLRLRAPVEAHLALTRRCTHHCPTCYMDSLPPAPPPAGELEEAGWRAVLRMLAGEGVLQVALGGGESLLVPYLASLAREARSLGLVPNLTTAGGEIDRGWCRTVAPLFGCIHVSLDGPAAVHDRLRGAGAWQEAQQALARLAAVHPAVGANLLLTRQGLAALEEVARLVRRSGGVQLELLRFKPVGRARQSEPALAPGPEELLTLWPRLQRLACRERGLRLRVDCSLIPFLVSAGAADPGLLRRLGGLGCEAGHWLVAVDPQGRLSGCSFFPPLPGAPDARLPGALRAGDPFAPFTSFRTAPPAPCRSCDAFALCLGGCRAVAFARTGDPRAPDPDCPRVLGLVGRPADAAGWPR
ncbi:MAG: radical SAM protein [Myxococcota bacterium]|nr:radical SAM protein [Myxococcota bacterium]